MSTKKPKRAPAAKAGAKKTAARKTVARKAVTKKTVAKKVVAKKAVAKKTAAKKPLARKTAVVKPVTRASAAKPSARKAAPAKAAAPAKGGMKAPHTLQEFMVYALAIEREAVDRYTEFADTMETHNNLEVAKMFRTMAGYEAKHAEQIKAEMGWTRDPELPGGLNWPGYESPEAVPIDEVHYLMQPWHALQLALAAEQRAEAFFKELARVATDPSVRKAALEMREEEAEHVELVKKWMEKVPKPDQDWSHDPDPPRYSD